jgi:Fic family protein
MELSELINKIDALKAELDMLKPIKPEFQKKLDEKILLEFNYNSNHLEGNTLTYGETELFLFRGETKDSHTFREYKEMEGHALAFELIKAWAVDEENPLTETMIKELNKIILKEPFYGKAKTPDGEKTQRLIKIGDYKEFPNNVELENGGIFEYVSPMDTPIKMGELIEWYRKEEKNKELHPAVLAALFHYRFVRIHPFDDGNGRCSRLLMNYILLKNNLPPVIIKSADKKNYLSALNNEDTIDIDYFVKYILNQEVWILDFIINGVGKGNFEEKSDLDKEIDILKREAKHGNKIKVKKSREAIQNIYRSSLQNLFVEIERQLSTFDELFFEKDINYSVQDPVVTNKPERKLSYIEEQIFFNQKVYTEEKRNFSYPDIHNIRVTFGLKKYQSIGVHAFDIYQDVEIYFSDTKYIIGGINGQNIIEQKLYDESLSNQEMIEIASTIKKQVLSKIKNELERIKTR